MGWRLARLHPTRSALLVLAVALPVGVGVAAAGLQATARISVSEFSNAVFGGADALVREAAGPGTDGALRYEDPVEEDRRLRALLPAGMQARWDLDLVVALQAGEDRRLSPQSRVLDLADPVNAPIYRVDAGAPSLEPATISLSSALADHFGVDIGDHVEVGPLRTAVRVTALISTPQDLKQTFAVLPTAAVLPGGPLAGTLAPSLVKGEGVGSSRWRVTMPKGTAPATLEAALSGHGFEVQPRSLAPELARPTPDLEAVALAFGLGLLVEVVVLISGAFAVVARTQQRQAALLAALGAPARVRRGVLLSYGVALGVTGAFLGGAIGILAAALLAGPLARRAAADWGSFDPGLGTAVVLVVCACVAAIAAAWWPARALASKDPAALLREATPLDRSAAGRPPKVVALLLTFAIVALGVSIAGRHPLPALAGALGGAAGTVFALMHVASRLASRDLSLLRPAMRVPVRALLALPGRTATVALAMSVVLALGTGVLVYVQTLAEHQARYHPYSLPGDTMLLESERPLAPHEVQSLVGAVGMRPPFSFSGAWLMEGEESSRVLVRTPYAECVDKARAAAGSAGSPVVDLTGCEGDGLGSDLPLLGVADVPDLERLLGRPLNPGERAAYDSGSALTTTSSSAPGEDDTIDLVCLCGGTAATERLDSLYRIPALAVTEGTEYQQLPVAFVSAATATQLGLTSEGRSYLLLPEPDRRPPMPDRVLQALPADLQQSTSITVESGPPLQGMLLRLLLSISLGALLTSAIVVGSAVALWSADLRGDYLMLGAVGASVGWRRRSGAWQGGLLGATAVVVGGGWGILGISAALARANSPGSFPWVWVATLSLGVIACAGAIGAALVPTGARAARRAG